MSRAINLSVDQDAVTRLCGKHAVLISCMEPLLSGGTRVVLRSADGAATVRRHMKDKIMEGPVVRGGLYVARRPVPTTR